MSEDETIDNSKSFGVNEQRIGDEQDCFQYSEYSLKHHTALCEITENSLIDILSSDAFLDDIPYDIAIEEVQSQIAVVKGQSITIYVKREPYSKFKIVVPETHTTVLDLKKAIKRKYELNQKRSANRQQCAGHRNKQHRQSQKSSRKSCQPYSNSDVDHNTTKISWRYIWRTYYLEYNGEPLSDDRQLLNEYGVRNKSTLQFVKKVKYLRRSNSTKQRV